MAREAPQEELLDLALGQHGLVTAREARELGVDPVRLRQMVQRGVVERVSRGVYRFALAPETRLADYAAATLWPQGVRAVLSHETALDLHELCDVNPERIDLTIPRAHRVRRRSIPERYRIHARDLTPRERTFLEGIPIVTPARAILDGIEIPLRASLVRQAIDTLRARGELNARDEERLFAALHARRDDPA